MDELPIVLVVEDESLLQELVKGALRHGGFDMTCSPNAAEAVELLKSGAVRYRALVTDINLQGPSNGWELAREVREIDPSFPVVYLTGVAAEEWVSQGVPNSVLLEKPFAPAQLVTAVSQLLNITDSPSISSLD
ncbi:MAG: response regulator [Bradyrhizobium sp.]|nr:response regulator [Pseudomonadota bacterium]MDE2473342.1 response regulator [Bradyrhizobium sp.]